ncbi:hypothetical protein EIN_499390 [Entamoeba invadens IP1]|uniref:Serine-threonine-isoleucine rich protein n=1 Tax=Entamoeba invadens IP1 TaxID=370355 RepID=A0A0A1UDZ3_ENTIV|nr:hypothetical protein EIN_499390 [Entamoeba invadens IP1]ELP94669.1 hypothetical protein EIN_499390 [Entamoeba invadens IP1]|eukprot:XP_004261440.1 hypothetical protein EIN_499390 [Entamoeba invadens IP1]
MIIFLIITLCSISLSLKCTVDTIGNSTCSCSCIDTPMDEEDVNECLFVNTEECTEGLKLIVETDLDTLELGNLFLYTQIDTEIEPETLENKELTEIKYLEIRHKTTLDDTKIITITNSPNEHASVSFLNTKIIGSYKISYISLGYASSVILENTFGYFKDSFAYNVTSNLSGIFMITMDSGVTSIGGFSYFVNNSHVRWSTISGLEKLCTYSESGKYIEIECDTIKHDRMTLVVTESIFTPIDITKGPWLSVQFKNASVTINTPNPDNQELYINGTEQSEIIFAGTFHIMGGLTSFYKFSFVPSSSNIIDSSLFNVTIINLSDDSTKILYLGINETTTATTQDNYPLYSVQLSAIYYRVTTDRNYIYCTSSTGTEFEEDDCNSELMTDENKMTLKYTGDQKTLPHINNHKSFLTYEFKESDNVDTIEDYTFNTLTVNSKNIYLTSVNIDTLTILEKFEYGTCFTGTTGSVVSNFIKTSSAGYILHDGSLVNEKTNIVGENINTQTYYRALGELCKFGTKCELTCDTGSCTFIQPDCEEYTTGNKVTLVVGDGTTIINSIGSKGVKVWNYDVCDLSAAGDLTISSDLHLTCEEVSNGNKALVIVSGAINITKYTSTATEISLLSSVPNQIVLTNTNFIWVYKDGKDDEFCFQISENYYRCTKTANVDLTSCVFSTKTTTNYVDCVQENTRHVDLNRMTVTLDEYTTYDQETTFNQLILIGKTTSCRITASTLTVASRVDVSACDFFKVQFKTSKSVEMKTASVASGFITVDNDLIFLNASDVTSVSILSNKHITGILESSGIENVIRDNTGNEVQYFYTNTLKCTFTEKEFAEFTVCYYILYYKTISVEVPTTNTVVIDAKEGRVFKDIVNVPTTGTLEQPNLSIMTLSVESTGLSITLNEINDLTLDQPCCFIAKKVTNLNVNSLGCYITIDNVESSVNFETTDIYFNGEITTTVDVNKVQVHNTYHRYGTISKDCTIETSGVYKEYDCNDKDRVDTEMYMKYVTSFNVESMAKPFLMCSIEKDGLVLSELKCKTTIIKIDTFTITNSNLGLLDINEVDNTARLIDGETTHVMDVLTLATSDKPIFYGITPLTINGTNPNLVSQIITSKHVRYFGNKNSHTKCVYDTANTFDINDCNTDASIGLDLTIKINGYNFPVFKFNTIVTTTEVDTIKSLNATTFTPFASFDKLTISDVMTVDTLELSSTYKYLYISTGKETPSIIKAITGGLDPIFIGNADVPTDFSFVNILTNKNRYFRGVSHLNCNCKTTDTFKEWDCDNDDDISMKGIECTDETIQQFTIPATSSNKFKSATISRSLKLYNINVSTLYINNESYTVEGRADNIIVQKEHKDGTYKGTMGSISANDTSFNNELTHYLTNSAEELTPNINGIYFIKIKDMKYRVSTFNKYYCTYKNDVEGKATYFESDCLYSSDQQILKIGETVPLETTSFALAGKSVRPFIALETTQNVLNIKTVNLTLLEGNSSIGKMQYTVGYIETFQPVQGLEYTISSTINNVVINYQQTDSYINGSVNTVTNADSIVSHVLFVLNSVNTPTITNTKIGENLYRISSKLSITQNTNDQCVLPLYTNSLYKFPLEGNLYNEFDCNKYAEDGNNMLKLISEKQEVDVTLYHLKSFNEASLLKATNIKGLIVKTLTTNENSIIFDSCDITSITFTEPIIKQYFFKNSKIDSYNGKLNPIFVLDEDSYNKYVEASSNLKVTLISTDPMLYRAKKDVVDTICTISTLNGFDEWDCNKYVETNPSDALMTLHVQSNGNEIPTKVLHFKTVVFANDSFYDLSYKKISSSVMKLDTFSLLSTNSKIYFNMKVELDTLDISKTVDQTYAFVVFNKGLDLAKKTGTSTSNYFALLGGSTSLSSSAPLKSVTIYEGYSRITDIDTLSCTYNKIENTFDELDCRSENSNEKYYKFTSSNFILKIVDTEITYSLQSTHFKSMVYPLDETNNTFTLQMGSKQLTFDTLEIRGIPSIDSQVTVNSEIKFDQTIGSDFMNRMISFNFGTAIRLLVKTSSTDTYTETTTVADTSIPLFTGTLSGKQPSFLNKDSCQTSVYYFKTSLSNCFCILTGNTLDKNINSFESETAKDCISDSATTIFTLQVPETVTTVNVARETSSFDRLVLKNDQGVTFNKDTTMTGNVVISFTSLEINSPFFFNEGVVVHITKFTFGANGFLRLITTDATTFPSTYPSAGILIIRNGITQSSPPTNAKTCSTMTNGDIRYVLHDKVTDDTDDGCLCLNQLADCKYKDFSTYYNIKVSSSLSLESDFNTFVFDLPNPQTVLTISSLKSVTVDTMNIINIRNLAQVIVSGEVKVKKLYNQEVYILFENYIPDELYPVSSTEAYKFNSILNGISGDVYYSGNCGIDGGHYYRNVYGSGVPNCSCYFNSMYPDCRNKPNNFDLKLDVPKNGEFPITLKWKSIDVINIDTTPLNLITLSADGNTFIVGNKNFKISSTPSREATLLFGNTNTAYVETSGVNVVINAPTEVTYPLFVSTDLINTLNSIKCNAVYRYFASGSTQHCDCTLVSQDGQLNSLDCAFQSTNYNAITTLSSITIKNNWYSLTTSSTGTLTINLDSKYITSIYTKCETYITGNSSGPSQIIPDGNYYVRVDLATTSTQMTVNIDNCKKYCLTYVKGVAAPNTQCGADNFRVSQNLNCYCSIQAGGNLYDESDCNHDSDLFSYDLYVSIQNLDLKQAKKYNKLLFSDTSEHILTSSQKIEFTQFDVNNKVTLNIVDFVIMNLVQKDTEKTITITSYGTITNLTPIASGFVLYTNKNTEQKLTVTNIVNAPTQCFDVVLSGATNLVHTKVVTLNSKQTIRTNECTDSDDLICYLTTETDDYDKQFSTINCPCDVSNSEETVKCQIRVQNDNFRTFVMDHNINATFKVDKNLIISSSKTTQLQIQSLVSSTDLITINANNGLSIESLTISKQTTISGNVDIKRSMGRYGVILKDNTMEITLTNFQFSSIFTTSTQSIVFPYIIKSGAESFDLNCIKCILEGRQTIDNLYIGNGNEYTVDETNTNTEISTINNIILLDTGTLVKLMINGAVNFGNIHSPNTIYYPIVISNLNKPELVTVTTNSAVQKMCNGLLVFGTNFDQKQFCYSNDIKTILSSDDVMCTSTSTQCILELISPSGSITSSITQNYDSVICKTSVCTIASLGENVKKLNLIGENGKNNKFVLPEFTESRFVIRASNCYLELKGKTQVSADTSVTIVSSIGVLTLYSTKLDAILSADNVDIYGDVVILNGMNVNTLLNLKSGSLKIGGELGFVGLTVESKFGALRATTLSQTTTGVISASKYYNHYADNYINCAPINSVLTTNNNQKSFKCYTTNVEGIDLMNDNSYMNHIEQNCKSLLLPISINSVRISSAEHVTVNSVVSVDVSNTKFGGSYTFTNFNAIQMATFLGEVKITCPVNSASFTITILGNGVISNCPNVIHNSINDVTLNQVPKVTIQNNGIFTLNSDQKNLAVTFENTNFNKTITLDVELETLDINNAESLTTTDFVLFLLSKPVSKGTISPLSYKCNKMNIVSGSPSFFSCSDFEFSAEYITNTPKYTPSAGCKEPSDVNCIAHVTIDATTQLESFDLSSLNSRTVILTVNVEKVVSVTLDKNVKNFTVIGRMRESKPISGVILSASLPEYTFVKSANLTAFNKQEIVISHVVYLNSDENSIVEITKLNINFWEFNCRHIKLSEVVGNVYSPIEVTELISYQTQLFVYQSIRVESLNIIQSYANKPLFYCNQNIESITILDILDANTDTCKIVADYLLVSVKPVVNSEISPFTKNNRIYVGKCTFEFTQCTLTPTQKERIDMHESSNYEYISLCPNSTVITDLSTASYEGGVTVFGISDKSYKQIKLPNKATLQSSATTSIEIKQLTFGDEITFESPYSILLLNSIKTENVKIHVNAHTLIKQFDLKSIPEITIKQGVTLTYSELTPIESQLSVLKVFGNDKALIGNTLTLTVTDLTFETLSSTNSIINVNKFNLEGLNIKFPSETTTKHIPLINTLLPMSSTSLPTDTTLVCNYKTLIYKSTSTSAFQCPDDVLCTVTDTENCHRKDTNKDYKQRYNIEISTAANSVVILEDNAEKTKDYDIVNVKQDGVTIQIMKGGIYTLNVHASGVKVTCIGDDADSNKCTIVVNTYVDTNQINLLGKNIILEEDLNIDNVISYVKITGDVSVSTFEATQMYIEMVENGILRVKQYASFGSLLLVKNSHIYAFESFDTSLLQYLGGEIVFDASDNQAVLNVNRFEVNTKIVQLAKDQCITPIIRKAFTNGEPVETNNVPELVWKGSVTFTEQGTMVYYDCGFSKLELCGSATTQHTCDAINCNVEDAETRQICYCTFNPVIQQDCILSCPIDSTQTCVFNPSQSTASLFNDIEINKDYILKIDKLFRYFVMSMSQKLNIVATKSVNIYQITDEKDKTAGEITIDSTADVSIDSIRLTQSGSKLIIKANSLLVREIYIENEVTLNINAPITLMDTSSNFNFDEGAAIPNVTRQIYFGKDAIINLYENAYFTIQGPIIKDPITNKFDATYNKLTLEECTVTLDADYIGKVTKNYPNVVFNFEVIGEVIVNKATVKYNDDGKGDKNVTLILNNDVSHITITEFETKNVIDDQNYALIIGQSNAVLDKTAIPELSCYISKEFTGKVNEQTQWERSQCPCDGETCIVNTELTTTPVTYEVNDLTFAKYYTTNGILYGSNANISELISLGGTTEIKVTNSMIEMVIMEKRGSISFSKPMMVPTINGIEESGTIDVKTHSLTTKSITNVDLSISTGSILLEKGTKGNFNGRTITVAASGRLDIYSSQIIFDDKTIFNMQVEAGQPALISVDDDALGDTLSITTAHFKVTIPSGSSGKVFTVLRVLTPINIANFEFTEDSTTPGGSVKTQIKSGTFAFKEACYGVVLTDLPNDQITCPEDRMARVVEKSEFPMYMIAVIVIFILILAVIVAFLIAYVVHVYIVRRKNMKVFEEGEEIAVDEKKQDEEIKNEDNKPIATPHNQE